MYMTSESLTVVRKRERMGYAWMKERMKEKHRRRMIFYRDLDFVFFAYFADGTTGGLGP